MKFHHWIISFLLCTLSFAQIDFSDALADSLQINDSLQVADSIQIADSLTQEESGLDSIVYASSTDSLIFYVKDKKMEMFGSGDLRHEDTDLKSGKIYVDFETNDIEAYGIESDTASGGFTQTPVLHDRGDEFFGTWLKYNFKTKRGYISYAETESDQGFYSGTKIKKVDEDAFFVQDGFYTSCEADHPHYGFFCYEMKVIPDEQVIGKWIWLTFGGVPLPVPIPFAVFPIQSGRRSGLIIPSYGSRGEYGNYFSKFGYFWAMSDYMDLTLTGDFYTRGGWGINSRFRYKKRYEFDGSIDGGYSNLHTGESTDDDRTEKTEWRISWTHNQTLSPTSRFDANLQFMSADYFRQTSYNLNDNLRNKIHSRATYYKNWDDFGASITINYQRDQELESGDITETLPSISFSKTQFYPFKSDFSAGDEAWYEKVGIRYSGQFQNRRRDIDNSLDVRGGVKHNISINASPKVGYISFSPSVSYEEKWYNKRIEKFVGGTYYSSGSDSIVTRDVDEINMLRTFDLGVSANTKLYGIFNIEQLGIQALRHTLIPAVTYNYRPDFSEDMWGYYDSYTSSAGEIIDYNKFEKEIYGGASSGERQNINFSLNQIFEMKTQVDPTDTTSKEEKVQLLNLSSSFGYNFAADSLNFSDLRLSYRTQIGQWFNFSGSSSFTPYDWDSDGRTVNTFLYDNGNGFLRMRNFSLNVSTSLSADKFRSREQNPQNTEEEMLDEDLIFLKQQAMYQNPYMEREPDFENPWNISLNYSYNVTHTSPTETVKRSTISGNVSFNLTKNWKFQFSGSYDLINNEFAAPQVTINRDLHCWVMNFHWNPVGTFRGYRFEIRVKAPHLQDLKLLKSDSFYSGR